jgi:flagellin-specific chaperone FliS
MAKRKNQRDGKSRSRTNPNADKAKEAKKLKALYARMRKKFSAADLQKYTEIEETVPAEQVLAEMEEIYRKFTQKRA